MFKPILGAAFAALIATSAMAQGVKVSNAAFKETEVKRADGRIERKLEPANIVTPGDHVVFVMGYANEGSKPADRVVITNPVPASVTYLGSTSADVPIVSVDGGKSFGALASLTIKNADSSTRPARTSDVTHVRWQITRALNPGETGQVSYRGQLK